MECRACVELLRPAASRVSTRLIRTTRLCRYIDYDALEASALLFRPKLIIAGTSAYA